MKLNPQVLKAAEWLTNQISQPENAFCDCGFSVSTHAGEIRRVDYTLTTKTKPTNSGGVNYADSNR